MIRKISAHYIFPVCSSPIKFGTVIIDNNSGIILDIIDPHGNLSECEKVEFYNGILIPGFISKYAHPKKNLPDNTAPDSSGFPIAIGKDCLIAGTEVSIFEILKVLGEKFPVPFDKLLLWFAKNGIKSFEPDQETYTIETGNKPGLSIISGFNFTTFQLTKNSTVKVLI